MCFYIFHGRPKTDEVEGPSTDGKLMLWDSPLRIQSLSQGDPIRIPKHQALNPAMKFTLPPKKNGSWVHGLPKQDLWILLSIGSSFSTETTGRSWVPSIWSHLTVYHLPWAPGTRAKWIICYEVEAKGGELSDLGRALRVTPLVEMVGAKPLRRWRVPNPEAETFFPEIAWWFQIVFGHFHPRSFRRWSNLQGYGIVI